MNRGTLLKAALRYQELGFSVIPVRPDKKPFIKWQSYQLQKPDTATVTEWWRKYPDANVGLVTGPISGVDVVDADSEQGREAINEYLKDSLLIPTVKTPKGYHYYFRHTPGLHNGVRVLSDCDLRTTGGYVVVPPSKNGEGRYAWLDGLKITDVDPPEMPEMLVDILRNGAALPARSHAHIKKNASSRAGQIFHPQKKRNNPQQSVTNSNIGFHEGARDNTLFHLAYHLVKSGMPEANIRKYIHFFGQNCTPPFPEKDVEQKIWSALKRAESKNRNLTQDVRDWISVTIGNFSVTFLYKELQIVTSEDKNKVRVILSRLVKEGIVERDPNRAGNYRVVDHTCEPIDWTNAVCNSVKITLPFELDKMIRIPTGSIIQFAGAQDAGKSAVMMNIARDNYHQLKVHYFSSEMNAEAFKDRMMKFSGVDLEMLKSIRFYERGSNFADVIKSGPGNLNLIDYLEIHENFYLVAKYQAEIHRKLNGAVAIIALQKDPKQLYGRGGSFAQEKPVLSVAIDRGVATISKFKGEWMGNNPNGKKYNFKIVDGCRLVKELGWHAPVKD